MELSRPAWTRTCAIGGIGDHEFMWITGDPEADALLDDPFALLIGMLLGQQFA